MKIKDATYTTEMVERRKTLTEEVYGCDECRCEIKEYPNESNRLEVTVFQNDGDDAGHLHFCSWKCTLKHIPKIKSDYFVSLPYLYFDGKDGNSRLASELISIIQTIPNL